VVFLQSFLNNFFGVYMPLLRETQKCGASLRFLFIAALLFSTLSCGRDAGVSVVDFSKTVDIDRPGGLESTSPPLRMAVAAMFSPKETFVYYRQLLDYIAGALGRDIQLIQRKTYGEINELLGKGAIDLAFICSGPYASGRKKYGFEALAVPVVGGKHLYESYLIVNRDSPYQRLENLQNRVFAFTDPESNTGKLVPTYWLQQQGETAESFFGKTIYTYSHDNSIMAVAKSLVDGAAVHGQIWNYFNTRDPVYTDKTRIIEKSEPFGNPPLVASSRLAAQKKKRIQQFLLTMHESPEGKQILDRLLIDRFIEPDTAWYDPVIKMQQSILKAKGLKFKDLIPKGAVNATSKS
jgi:phosphate/phosphite/phosphonate ABC transporter binding protein